MGIPRATLAEQFCRTDLMLRLWIEMFNRGGIDALITKTRPGRRRKVKLERGRDLLVSVLQIELGYSTTLRWLHGTELSLACASALARAAEMKRNEKFSGETAHVAWTPMYFQIFLNEMAKAVPPKTDVRQILILDNASWQITLS